MTCEPLGKKRLLAYGGAWTGEFQGEEKRGMTEQGQTGRLADSGAAGVAPELARRVFGFVEPIHAMIYFCPHAPRAYARVGIRDARMGYLASRSAALGPVPAEVTIATFFNFSPQLVRQHIPAAWDIAPPKSILAARLDAADLALRQIWGDRVSAPQTKEVADLARRAAEAAAARPEGRPLFAAHAALDWPDQPHLVLWHAQTLLREFRGDGHVAILNAEGLDAVEALVVHSATGEVSPQLLTSTRGWSQEEWDAGVERVRSRGWLEPGPELDLSPKGWEHRQMVEDRTDALTLPAYRALGEEGCQRLIEMVRPLSKAVIDSGFVPFVRRSTGPL